jgi:hypothetical protein
MKLNPKNGIDQLLFGMKQNDVKAIYGEPDKRFEDEESNTIYVYNTQKLRLTFYEDEDFRLGYIISANPELELFDSKILGKTAAEAKENLFLKGLKSWEQEDFDLAENHFNEANWLILQSEYGTIVKVELGAIINDKDDFEWKFPTNKKG